MFAFNRTPFLITEGYRAVNEALDLLPADFSQLPPGLHPQREMTVRVERARCVGCGACVARAPDSRAFASCSMRCSLLAGAESILHPCSVTISWLWR